MEGEAVSLLSTHAQTLGIVSAIVGFIGQFITIVWKLSKIESNIHTRIEDVEHELETKIQGVRLELLQTKLEASNQYMRTETFKEFMTGIDARLIRLEGKLDTALSKN